MTELDQKTWDVFVARFGNRLGAGCTLDHALKMFIEDYSEEIEYIKEIEVSGPPVTKKFVDERFSNVWDFVHTLKKLLLEQQKHIDELKFSKQKYGVTNHQTAPCGEVGGHIHTTGYVQTQYTPEQIEEWNNIKFNLNVADAKGLL